MCFTLVGCSEISKTIEREKTKGYILEVKENRVLVAEDITEEEYETIIDKSKSITELDEERISLIYFSYVDTGHLHVGDKVEIWFDGNMETSYPAQAEAIKTEVKE